MQSSSEHDEYCHIASLVLWIGDRAAEIQKQLTRLDWVECPLQAESGKCVEVLEASTDEELIGRIDYIRDFPGVVDVQLVYHLFDEL